MKKSIGILIAAILVLTATCGLCDDDSSDIPYVAVLTSTLTPDTALEIITSDDQRAILTVCLALDFGVSDGGRGYMSTYFATFLFDDSYVVSDGTFIVVTGYAGGKLLSLFYYPETKQALYHMTDTTLSDELMDILIKTAAQKLPFSYKNDVGQLVAVTEVITKAMNN